jgi:hypothetical protein
MADQTRGRRNKKPIPPNERKLRRKLSEMAGQVRAYLAELDRVMQMPDGVERGKRIAQLSNALEVYNDQVRYFWCGVDYRTDARLRTVAASTFPREVPGE